MTTTDFAAPAPTTGRSASKITLQTATAIAVADMIGIGVFTSLGFQVAGIPSGFAILALWILGGIVALCGALCYAELATALPRSGGEYNFLSRIYHPAVGFLAGWISATVGFAAPVALAAMAFGQYFIGVIPGPSPLVLALALTWLVGFIHLAGLKPGSTFHNIATGIKVLLIIGFIVAGLAIGEAQPVTFTPAAKDVDYILSAPFAISLIYVLYAYSGWNAATYISEEVAEPQRNLPRAILAAVVLVTLLYVALNFVFLYTTPIDKMAGQLDVALVAGRHIFGDTGGRIISALICFGLISTVSAMIWIGPRVTMVMGQDFPVFRVFARKTAGGVPAMAILLQLSVVTFMLLTQSFETVLEFIQFSLTFCCFLTVLGLIVLRWTQPDLPRPYRTWGYPITPLIFLGVTGAILINMLVERPSQSLASLALMLAGLIVYALTTKLAARRSELELSTHG